MANLPNIITKIPGGGVTRTQGVMVLNNGVLAVNVWGNIIPARYADPLVVNAGDTVAVDLMAGPTGQGAAVVSGRLTTAPRPGTGTVTTVPPSSPTITVTGTDSKTYTAYFVGSYTPTVGDNVILAWNAATPTVTGKVGATVGGNSAPASNVAPPPAPTSTGTSTYAASDSGTWTPAYGAWDAWAGGGGAVYEGGAAYGAANYGAWFYAGSPGELSGRTITRIRINLGRRNVGNYNQAAAVNFYAHTNANKPGGDVNRTVGPTVISIPPGFYSNTDLPLSFAPVLQAGGGIAIAGEPYAGFNGRNTQPDSGLLTIDWTR